MLLLARRILNRTWGGLKAVCLTLSNASISSTVILDDVLSDLRALVAVKLLRWVQPQRARYEYIRWW